MAIAIRFLTVVLKKTAINTSYPGGLVRFLNDRQRVAQDEHLVGVPFMSGDGLQRFIDLLRAISFGISGGLAIGEMINGELQTCDGIEIRTVGSADPFPEWEAVALRAESPVNPVTTPKYERNPTRNQQLDKQYELLTHDPKQHPLASNNVESRSATLRRAIEKHQREKSANNTTGIEEGKLTCAWHNLLNVQR